MIDIFFDKLYRYDRIAEPCYIGIPVKEGELTDISKVAVYQGEKALPVQSKVTSRHKDGSVRFLFVRFMADLPGNKGAVLQCDLHGENAAGREIPVAEKVQVHTTSEGITVSTGCKGQ